MRDLYVADPPGELTVVALESLAAVFHAASGMTHLLASPAPEILEALSGRPGDVDAIIARLADRHEIDPVGAREAISARLGELEAGGLVRRV